MVFDRRVYSSPPPQHSKPLPEDSAGVLRKHRPGEPGQGQREEREVERNQAQREFGA